MSETGENGKPISVEAHPFEPGRAKDGTFLPGNAAKRGVVNNAATREAYKRAVKKAVSDRDLFDLMRLVYRLATKTRKIRLESGEEVEEWIGEPWAVREVLDRTLGKFDRLEDEAPEGRRDIKIMIVDARRDSAGNGSGNGNGSLAGDGSGSNGNGKQLSGGS